MNKLLEFQKWVNGNISTLSANAFDGSNVYVNNISPRSGETSITMDGQSLLTVSGFSAVDALGNTTTINNTVTVPTNYNSLLFGPITIGTNGTFTIGESSVVKIKDISDV